MTTTAKEETVKRGSLVCVGSGIKSIGHLTLEAQGWITSADLVVYCVADPATEIWIKRHARAHFDLYTLYDNDKRRISTYEEMVGVMVDHVREGKDVCAVFYGHPGVFVLPTHRAIETLRGEGYPAAMLPAISALDCLFADIGVDPAGCGCQTVEATDLLLRRRPILTESHVVIWQIGCVGDLGFRFAGYDNRNLGVLVDYLREHYGGEQEVVHYQAAQFPVCSSVVDRTTIDGLLDAPITGISTLYIPPAATRPTVAQMASRLGLRLKGQPATPPAAPAPAAASTAAPDGAARPRWQRDVPVRPYTPSKPSSALADCIADLMLEPRTLAEFNADPELVSLLYEGMTDDERAALLSRHPGRIRIALKAAEHPALDDLDAVHGEPLPAAR